MIINAFILAGITFVCFLKLYLKAPNWFRNLVLKFPLLSDALACLGCYMLLGRTLTALLASGLLGIIISGALYFAKGEKPAFLSPREEL